jgi:hypothetical protein
MHDQFVYSVGVYYKTGCTVLELLPFLNLVRFSYGLENVTKLGYIMAFLFQKEYRFSGENMELIITLRYIIVRFEVFTAVTMKNGVFWAVTPCGSCKNRRFGGTWRLLHQGDKNR